jgi:hypothetical protein
VPQQEPSFSEEKEAKRLFMFGAERPRAQQMKVSWFFFSKKNK